MGNKIALFLIALILWCCLRKPQGAPDIFAGIAAAMLIAILTGNLFTSLAGILFKPKKILWLALFFVTAAAEWAKASIFSGYRLIKPRVETSPDVIEVGLGLKNEPGLTLLANTLTLTLDVLLIDIDTQKSALYLYCVDAEKNKEKRLATIGKLENLLKKIYEE